MRHILTVSDKSLLVLLAAAHPAEMFQSFPRGPEPLQAGHFRLAWNYTQQFILLGIRCQAAHYSTQRLQVQQGGREESAEDHGCGDSPIHHWQRPPLC
jgi:hypothetical protein